MLNHISVSPELFTLAAAEGVSFHVRHAEVTLFLSRDNPRIQEKIDSVTAGFGRY